MSRGYDIEEEVLWGVARRVGSVHQLGKRSWRWTYWGRRLEGHGYATGKARTELAALTQIFNRRKKHG